MSLDADTGDLPMEGSNRELPSPLPRHHISDITDSVDVPFDSIWCPTCSRQIVPRRIDAPAQPHPNTPAPGSSNTTQCKTSYLPDASSRLTRDKTVNGIHPRTEDLVHTTSCTEPRSAIERSPAEGIPPDAVAHAIPSPKPAMPVRRCVVIDQRTAPLYCSDECRLADPRSCRSAVDIGHKAGQCASSLFPPTPPHSVSDGHGSQDKGDWSSALPFGSGPFASSPITTSTTAEASPPNGDPSANAYSRLSAIYGFAPLPPPPPSVPKPTTSVVQPRLEGGIILAARHIQAALCTKTVTLVWGFPVHNDPKEDNKPIPGWTDGSNAWRASTYGFAPPRDFTRTDPDDAAIRAYGSCVASPHRSRGAHSSLGDSKPATQIKTSLPHSPPPIDASTQKLYQQYSASLSQRFQSRRRASIHARGVGLTLPTGSVGPCLVRKVSLLKPGAEGRLAVPNVKMRRTICVSASVETEGGNNERSAAATSNSLPTNGESGPIMHSQSYASEVFTYPIMRITPEKVKRIERRVVDGVECEVEVEVEVEKPIKRLFLFGGARD